MKYLIHENDVSWVPHPSGLAGVEMKKLRSGGNGEFQESIAIVKIEAGSVVPAHIHEQEDDNLYILSGRGRMKVGPEVYELLKGAQVSVPAGIDHEIFDVTEDLCIYDIFVPGIF